VDSDLRPAFFALVHGGAHGGWCWEELTPELERLGHRCSAPDLPFEDPHGTSDWADAVIATIPRDAEQVIVVGHSLAGLCLPIIAARRPVDRLVFLGAMVPIPGQSFVEMIAAEPDALPDVDFDEIRDESAAEVENEAVMSFARAKGLFYGDLDKATSRRAWERLRMQGMTAFIEPCPLQSWPDVASTYILMTEDAAVSPAWSRRVATGRLGADVIELPGSHSPFYSRPQELAETLDALARRAR
jgi:pimeloyl-ACP methyl ester carboxylesterase